MADRTHPYSMFSQSLTSSSLQQSQIPQQPPQSQQPDPQMLSALSNPEHSRMWQMNQLQNAYRPQQSGDLAASQMNHQMQEFARGQGLPHGQGQPVVQPMQQSFGLNGQRAGPPFHDPQANLSQLLMSSNAPNVPMNTQQQMKAPFNMNPMMRTLNNSGIPLQRKMFSQQEIARLQQSGFGAQHAPNQQSTVDMFPSTSMQPSHDQMHGSPHPGPQPIGPPGGNQGVPGNQQPNAPKRMADFQERRSFLHNRISQSETQLNALVQSARNSPSVDPVIQQKINQLRSEIVSWKEMYARLVATFGAMVTQQMANGIPPSSVPHMNAMAHAASQQPQQGIVSNPQVQPGFVAQANHVSTPYNIPVGNGSSPMPTQNQGTLNQQLPITTTPIGRPNTMPPPRTGGTPHQAPVNQLPSNASPNLRNFVPQGGQNVPNLNHRQPAGGYLPLDHARFEATYVQFCRSQSMPVPAGLRVSIGEDRTVDLHKLHVSVMHEGGASDVTARDMWAVIGGRLGIVQFPGNDPQSSRAGPGIAQQLQNTYEQYLQHFENAYIMTVKNRTGSGSPQQQLQINASPLPVGDNATPGLSGNPAEMAQNPTRFNPQLFAMALRFANTTAQEMRAQGVHEQIINFVERQRSELLRVHQLQMQQIAKRNAEQEQQNKANVSVQPPHVPERPSIGLQPGTQRPQPIGANNMIGMPPGDVKMPNGTLTAENTTVALNQQPPTHEQIQQAMMVIHQLKHVFQQRGLQSMTLQQIPDEHRLEYNQLLEQVYKMTSELDPRLHLVFAVFKSEELLRRYVAIVMTVARQRQLLSTSSPPQYIIPLQNLRNMQLQVHKLNEEFENRSRAMKASMAAVAAANSQQHTSLIPGPVRKNTPSPLAVPPVQNASQMALATLNNGRQVTVNPSPQQQTHLQPPAQIQGPPPPPPQPQTQPNPPVLQQPSVSQPPKKPFHPIPPSPSAPPTTTSLTSPTPPPAASSSTPATSAPTPQTAVGSPQTPKSPPTKAIAKGKASSRISRKLSAAGKAPATPEATPSVVGVKRPPEEDVSTFTNVGPSEADASNAPSPKKVKTEWEGETSEALLKKQQALHNINTEEEATAFFDSMKEFFAKSATTDNDIHHDIACTLDQILAGVAQEPADAAATAAALSVHGAGDAGPPPTALSPPMGPANDAFLEFIDFSSFTTLDDEDNDSKAPTPDLVHSETNPSPESGSEGDSLGNTGSPDKTKIEEAGDRSDPLRLGSLREIDGGESAYYQADNWKWEGPMHTIDQPWAIFTS